jgi:hypothetical protein
MLSTFSIIFFHFISSDLTQLLLYVQQCVSSVLELIAKSLDAWRTRQYDYYQKVLNGIL